MNSLRTIIFLTGCLFAGIYPAVTSGQTRGHCYLAVGSYTQLRERQGIAIYEFDTETGDLLFRSVTGGIDNPSYLTVTRDGGRLYAVSEKDHGPGSVVAYHIDSTTGQLSLINRAPSGGKGPCYISVDDAGTHVFTANYSNGSLGVIRLNDNGSLDTTRIRSIQHTGGGIDKVNQAGPHAHSAVLSPDGRYLLSANLGNDHIYIYQTDTGTAGSLRPANPAYVTVAAGSGPRHICFHPSGKYVYIVNEMAGSIDIFRYNDGRLDHLQTITMLPENFHGVIEAADIHISPDGRYLYASNREERNEIVIYSIDTAGLLSFVHRQPVLGVAPRNFAIDPTGNFLLVANLKTNAIIVFRRDTTTGLLTFTGKQITSPSPACLKFIRPLHPDK